MNNKNWIKILSLLTMVGLFSACASPATKPDETAKPEAKQQVEKKPEVKMASSDSYLVVRGDSLWKISGKPDIYNNPYEWPLIYKANRDKIKDADLIYPGQKFTISRGDSQAAIDAAIHHAKTRGAWSLGKVEASDKAYLGM